MGKIEIIATGLVYRNPRPHVKSVHAYFGSVTAVSNNEMLAAFDLGSAFEAVDCHPHLARSTDGGQTWTPEGPLWPRDPAKSRSATCRIAAMPGGEIVGVGAEFRRDDPEVGLTNPAHGGFVPTRMVLVRSTDGGRTWQGPTPVKSPLPGAVFEICSTVRPLRNGRWAIPTATWMDWDGKAPHGMKAVALFSRDDGRTWPEYSVVMDRWSEGIVHWEHKLLALPDGRLLATAWTHHLKENRDLPNHYAISRDGRTFSPPRSMGLTGQTMATFLLRDGRVLCVYRRTDQPGLWAQVGRLDGDDWVNEFDAPLWGMQAKFMDRGRNMITDMSTLRFGFPCGLTLPDGDVYFVFWCYEDCVSNIRWFRLRVTD